MKRQNRRRQHVRHVRCPDCRKVYTVPVGTPADRGSTVRFWDWPLRRCTACQASFEYEQVIRERQALSGGEQQGEPGIDSPDVLG